MANEVIYIPEYVEQGVAKLQQAKNILAQIESYINSGISTVNASGYNRGIPHIEKGNNESTELSSLEATIDTITSEIYKYSNGDALDIENAIIIADPSTISKYGLKKEDIDYTLSDYILKSDNVSSNPTIQARWESGYLTAGAGFIKYTGADGRLTKETWCDLNPNNLAKLMREDHGIELDYWIREDGVYMYGDYVMVAADIPHMDGTQQEAEYRKGDLVQTSLGTGMVVDYCGMANSTRRGNTDVDVWYDIYTDWHGRYSHVGYCTDAGCNDASHTNTKSTMIRKAENPTTINPRTGQPISSGFVFNSNTTTTTKPTTDATQTTTTPDTSTSNTTSNTTFETNTNKDTSNKNNQTSNTTTNTTPSTNTTTNNVNNSTGTFVSTQNTTNNNTTTNTGTNPGSNTYYPTSSTTTNSSSSTYYPSSSTTTSSGGSNTYYPTSSSTTSSTTQQPTNQVTNINNVNGFSKPVTNTQTSTPVVNTPVASTPVVSNPVVEQPVINNVTTTPTVSDQIMTPEVDVNNNTNIIDVSPTILPEIPEIDNTTDIIENDNTIIEQVPTTQPSDAPIKESSSNMPLIATLTATGAIAAGVGAKIYLDKKKQNQDNGENEEE